MAKHDLRTDETLAFYNSFIKKGGLDSGCPLCNKPSIAEFVYWRVVENSFPYDRIADVHHMLIPKIHTIENRLSAEALQEFMNLKGSYLNDHYDLIIEALPNRKSVPSHHHYHLIVQKEI